MGRLNWIAAGMFLGGMIAYGLAYGLADETVRAAFNSAYIEVQTHLAGAGGAMVGGAGMDALYRRFIES